MQEDREEQYQEEKKIWLIILAFFTAIVAVLYGWVVCLSDNTDAAAADLFLADGVAIFLYGSYIVALFIRWFASVIGRIAGI